MEIMNLSLFLDEMDNDYDIVGNIVSQYILSISKQLENMNNLLLNRSYSIISMEAHSIKGGARNLMAPRLEQASKKLEEAAVDKDDIKIKKCIDSLNSEYIMYKNFILDNLSSVNLEC